MQGSAAALIATLGDVRTVVLGPRPRELEGLIQRRRALGIDTFDEVWEGSYHMAPAAHPAHGYVGTQLAVLLAPFAKAAGLIGTDPFNLGEPDDYRVPDRGYHRSLSQSTWVPTAAVVVEVVSPDDETYEKFGFYAAHGVDELIVADPTARTVTCWTLEGAAYRQTDGSALLAINVAELQAGIAWP
jgi:Uma2 family endonuclease